MNAETAVTTERTTFELPHYYGAVTFAIEPGSSIENLARGAALVANIMNDMAQNLCNNPDDKGGTEQTGHAFRLLLALIENTCSAAADAIEDLDLGGDE